MEISQIAAQEFQEFMISEAHNWGYDFNVRQGKMFGVLVVQREDGVVGFLGAVSGKLPGSESSGRFVPSVFDESIDNYFFNRGMTELTVIGEQIGMATNSVEVKALKEKRSQKSKDLQKWLFENYNF